MMTEHEITRREFLKTASAAVVGASLASAEGARTRAHAADAHRILNHNRDMEYRRCGKTGWMVSAVCLGGHWKRINQIIGGEEMGGWFGDVNRPDFQKNRREVVTRCIERGINYIDACASHEILAYSKALEGRRDRMYLGWSWYELEPRDPKYRTAEALMGTLDHGMRESKLDYVDLWRISAGMMGSQGADGKWVYPHTAAESAQIAEALGRAKKAGKIRAGGISSHDRPWLEYMMKTFPDQIEVVVTPYTAATKALPKESFFDTVKACDCGFFGIKPFSSNALFKGDSSPDSPTAEEDNRLARLALRYILCNPVITAPIPGLITVQQVDNAALAVKERRELDLEEKAALNEATDRAWANLPPDYHWLRNWEYV